MCLKDFPPQADSWLTPLAQIPSVFATKTGKKSERKPRSLDGEILQVAGRSIPSIPYTQRNRGFLRGGTFLVWSVVTSPRDLSEEHGIRATAKTSEGSIITAVLVNVK